MSELFAHCEHFNFWGFSQPLNVLSSTGFWLVAWYLYYQYRPKAWSYSFWLIAGIEFIGWASLFWHAVHGLSGIVLDISSIVLWLGCFGAYACHRKYGWSYIKGASLVFLFLGLSWVFSGLFEPWMLQTGVAFVPLALLLIWAAWYDKNRWWAYTGLSLMVSIVLRVVDLPICSNMPLGTHWLWHLGCAFSLYAAMRALLGKPKKSNRPSAARQNR